MQDGNTTTDTFKQLLNVCLQRSTAEGLRDRLAFCLGHFGLLRSDNTLQIELADLASVDLPNEGPSPCFAVTVLLDNGKTNKDGRCEYAAFSRNKDVEACGVNALAFYLFFRYSCFVPSYRADRY